MADTVELKKIATQLRRDIIRMTGSAGSGHPGGSLSATEAFTALFFKVMKHNPDGWERSCKGQDAFILSAGHLAPAYYAALARAGYFPVEELASLRKFGTRLQGHPSIEKGLPGIVQPSGSLGQGLACAAGIALGKKLQGDTGRVFCLLGDGEQEEGQVWESAIFAAHHSIGNLVAITDWNHKQIDGDIDEVAGLGDLAAKWEAFGWRTVNVADGNDIEAVVTALEDACKGGDKPVMVLLNTVMGRGVDFMEDKHGWHGKAPKAEEVTAALAQLEETIGDY